VVHGNEPLRVYSRPGCHLCEQLIEDLLPLARGRVGVEVVDIDTREEWQEAYGTRIPVLEYRGKTVCQYTLDVAVVRRIIDAASGS